MKNKSRSKIDSRGTLFSEHPQILLEPCLIYGFSPKHKDFTLLVHIYAVTSTNYIYPLTLGDLVTLGTTLVTKGKSS